MRERGRYQIQFMKTRSSSGVGSKVDLKFDPDTLRVEDLDDDEEGAVSVASSGLLEQLSRNKSIKAEDNQAKDTVSQALNMREFMKKNDL